MFSNGYESLTFILWGNDDKSPRKQFCFRSCFRRLRKGGDEFPYYHSRGQAKLALKGPVKSWSGADCMAFVPKKEKQFNDKGAEKYFCCSVGFSRSEELMLLVDPQNFWGVNLWRTSKLFRPTKLFDHQNFLVDPQNFFDPLKNFCFGAWTLVRRNPFAFSFFFILFPRQFKVNMSFALVRWGGP